MMATSVTLSLQNQFKSVMEPGFFTKEGHWKMNSQSVVQMLIKFGFMTTIHECNDL